MPAFQKRPPPCKTWMKINMCTFFHTFQEMFLFALCPHFRIVGGVGGRGQEGQLGEWGSLDYLCRGGLALAIKIKAWQNKGLCRPQKVQEHTIELQNTVKSLGLRCLLATCMKNTVHTASILGKAPDHMRTAPMQNPPVGFPCQRFCSWINPNPEPGEA